MKLSKLVEALEKIKKKYGEKEVKEVIVTDFEIKIIFEDDFILEI